MIKILTLIGIMFVGSVFAAGPPLEGLDGNFEFFNKRFVYNVVFEGIAHEAFLAGDDIKRGELNNFLESLFKKEDLLEQVLLRSIKTKAEAEIALNYYRSVNIANAISAGRVLWEKINSKVSTASDPSENALHS